MKRILAAMIALLLLLAGASACAEETDTFWELDPEECVLTVRLPANATTGYEWTFESSDTRVLDMLTSEYVEDEHEEGMVGVGGTWVASFANTDMEFAGEATLTLKYVRPWETEAEPAETHVIKVWVVENGTLEVLEVD